MQIIYDIWYKLRSFRLANLKDLSYTDGFMTNHHLKDLLPGALLKIESCRQGRPDLILSAWKEVVSERWRAMTDAISFEKGVIVVKVRSAALYSLLVQQQGKLLRQLQERFPQAALKRIKFER